MACGIQFQENMRGHFGEGLYDPWRAKETETSETFAWLENLPALNSPFPDNLRYDASKKLLYYTGVMTPADHQALQKLSGNPAYQTAINEIFERFENLKAIKVELKIKINDLETFLEKPEHSAELAGYVYYNGRHPIKEINDFKPRFKLFSREPIINDPTTGKPVTCVRHMVYEMPFEIKEGDKKGQYFLFGYKEIGDAPMRIDMLEIAEDMTTLFTTLYRISPNGKTITQGTGILQYDLKDLPVLMTSFKVNIPWYLNVIPLLQVYLKSNRRHEFLEFLATNVRDTYSLVRARFNPEELRGLVRELDRLWFISSFTLWLVGGPLHWIDNHIISTKLGTYLVAIVFVLLVLFDIAIVFNWFCSADNNIFSISPAKP